MALPWGPGPHLLALCLHLPDSGRRGLDPVTHTAPVPQDAGDEEAPGLLTASRLAGWPDVTRGHREGDRCLHSFQAKLSPRRRARDLRGPSKVAPAYLRDLSVTPATSVTPGLLAVPSAGTACFRPRGAVCGGRGGRWGPSPAEGAARTKRRDGGRRGRQTAGGSSGRARRKSLSGLGGWAARLGTLSLGRPGPHARRLPPEGGARTY